MGWTYLAESADSPSPWCPGSGQLPTVKTTDTLRGFFFHGWQTAPFPLHRSGTTCEHCDGTGIYPASTSSTGASPARTSALRALEQGWTASALGFSLRLSGSFARFDRATCSWRMLQPSLFEGSIASPVSWPRSGLIVDGICYELAMWERPKKEKDGGFWPTPTARGYKSPGLSRTRKAHATRRQALPLSVVFKERFGYRLPPSFVEYLMGYDPQHTVCAPWAMQWYQRKPERHSVD